MLADVLQAYLRENLLQQHMRSHQGLRPYVCNECGAQFTMKSNFKRHVEEHAGQRYLLYPPYPLATLPFLEI